MLENLALRSPHESHIRKKKKQCIMVSAVGHFMYAPLSLSLFKSGISRYFCSKLHLLLGFCITQRKKGYDNVPEMEGNKIPTQLSCPLFSFKEIVPQECNNFFFRGTKFGKGKTHLIVSQEKRDWRTSRFLPN